MVGYREFKLDSQYLLRNNRYRILALLGMNLLLIFTCNLTPQMLLFFPSILLISRNSVLATSIGAGLAAGILMALQGLPSLSASLYIPIAIIATFPLTALYHCASHSAFRPRWLNRCLGEVVGLWHMSSIDEWSIVHSFHHSHSDHPKNDPHPPAALSFFEFTKTTAKTIAVSFGRHFVAIHGEQSGPVLKKISLLSKVRQILLSIFWFLLLGPEIYIYLFATNIVFKKVHYAWFNWATHKHVGDEVHVIDLNHGIYRVINLIAFNLYNHGSHHAKPTALKPEPSSQPVVSQKKRLQAS